MAGLNIKNMATSIEHPLANGQAKATNKVIMVKLKKQLHNAKGRWAKELFEVLWAYQCIAQSATQETPFWLVYGTYAMVPIEVREI